MCNKSNSIGNTVPASLPGTVVPPRDTLAAGSLLASAAFSKPPGVGQAVAFPLYQRGNPGPGR